MKFFKRVAAALMACCLMCTLIPSSLAAGEGVTVVASTASPIVVQDIPSDLDLLPGDKNAPLTASIDRDYEQEVQIELSNPLEQEIQYYMTVNNPYPDLSMNFVNTGVSEASPAVIGAASGDPIAAATDSVVLMVFAQEAEKTTYDNIEVVCHISGRGSTSRKLTLTVNGDGMQLSGSGNALSDGSGGWKATLANTGTNAVNSLKVMAADGFEDYVVFPSPVMNLPLAAQGETITKTQNGNLGTYTDSVTFDVLPSSAVTEKMENIKLVAKGNGSSYEFTITLEPPTSPAVTGEELALTGNNYITDVVVPDGDTLGMSGADIHYDYTVGENRVPVSISVVPEKVNSSSLTSADYETSEGAKGISSNVTIETTANSITLKFKHLMSIEEFEALAGVESPSLRSSSEGETTDIPNAEAAAPSEDSAELPASEENRTPADEGQTLSLEENGIPADEGQKLVPEENGTPAGEGQELVPEGNGTPTGEGQELVPEGNGTPTGEGQELMPEENGTPAGESQELTPEENGTSAGESQELTPDEALLMDNSDMDSVLVNYSITIDFSQLSPSAMDDIRREFDEASANDPRLTYVNNMPDLPEAIRNKYTAAVQMRTLLKLLEEDSEGKYTQFKQKLAEEIAKQYPGVQDPVKVLESTLDSLIVTLKNSIVQRYDVKDFPNAPSKPAIIEDIQKNEEEERNNSVIIVDERGHQCTNRGSITSSFHSEDVLGRSRASYAANRTAADAGVKVFYTGRIVSEDQYINFEPITYDLILNNEKLPLQSENSGLSELNIIELPADKVYLGKKNTFTRDYDVNPGTHFINTDNQFTLVYPAGAPLPKASAAASVPDFDIYKKNVFVVDTAGNYVESPIAGNNKLHVSVSNRGAHGGFYQLSVKSSGTVELLTNNTVSDNGTTREVYRYLPAFTSETLILDVNLPAGDTTIEVTIKDCSGSVKEINSANNTATATIAARSRETPNIESLTPNGTVSSDIPAAVLTATLSGAKDVTNVRFQLDGRFYSATPNRDGSSWSATVSGLNYGTSYPYTATVTYLTGGPDSTFTSDKTGTAAFTLNSTEANEEWANVTLPGGITSCALLAFSDRYGYSPCDFNYSISPSTSTVLYVEQNAAPQGMYLLAYNETAKKLYAVEVGAKGAALDLTAAAQRTVTLSGGTFSSFTYSAYVYLDTSYNIACEADQKTLTLPALKGISVSADVKLEDDPDTGRSTWVYEYFDLSQSNQTWTLPAVADVYANYTFTKPADNTGANTWTSSQIPRYVYSYYYYSDPNGSQYLRYNFVNLGNNKLNTDGSITASLDKNNLYDTPVDAYIYLYANGTSDQQAYALILKDSDCAGQTVDLGTVPTHTLSFTASDPSKLDVNNVYLYPTVPSAGYSLNCYLGGSLEKDTVKCTPGQYSATVSFNYDGKPYNVSKTVDLTSRDAVVNLVDNLSLSTLKVSWDEDLGTSASVYLPGSGSYSVANSGDTVSVPAGAYNSVSVTVSGNGNSYTFSVGERTLTSGATEEVNLGKDFTGTLAASSQNALPGAQMDLRITGLTDQYGNRLTSESHSGGVDGYIVFTGNNGESTRIPVSASNYYNASFSVTTPSTAGSYIAEFVTSLALANMSRHTITVQSSGNGSVSPSGQMVVRDGGSISFTITPNAGYRVGSVRLDGAEQGTVTSLRLDNVTSDHVLEVSFVSASLPPAEEGEEDMGFIFQPPAGWGGSSNPSTSSNAISVPTGITGGQIKVQPGSAAKGEEVTITATPNDGYVLDTLTVKDSAGNEIPTRSIGDDKYVFTMPGSKVSVDAQFKPIGASPSASPSTSPSASFADVSASAYYANAVSWAVENGITNGVSDTSFAPDLSCTRAQVVTFLWRAAGSPSPSSAANPFADVQSGAYYYDAVLWAAEKGITSGVTATAFDPDATVTRGQTVTFLYRYAGSPSAGVNSGFTDVNAGDYYADAVSWAVGNGITNGVSTTSFAPGDYCTRAQIVTFLYRYMVG